MRNNNAGPLSPFGNHQINVPAERRAKSAARPSVAQSEASLEGGSETERRAKSAARQSAAQRTRQDRASCKEHSDTERSETDGREHTSFETTRQPKSITKTVLNMELNEDNGFKISRDDIISACENPP